MNDMNKQLFIEGLLLTRVLKLFSGIYHKGDSSETKEHGL